MTQEEIMRDLFDQFRISAEQFRESTGGSRVLISPDGEHQPEKLSFWFADIQYPLITIRFRYTAKAPVTMVPSVLEGCVFLGAPETSPGISLPYFADFCDIGFLMPPAIPLITCREDMEEAFQYIGGMLRPLLGTAVEISADPTRKEAFYKQYLKEFYQDSGMSEREYLQYPAKGLLMESYVRLQTARSTFSEYFYLISGQYKKRKNS